MSFIPTAYTSVASAGSSSAGMSGSGAGMIGPIISGIGQIFANRSRKREARRQRKWNEKMWHMQNAYNHPVEQMARIEQAGLNKNLMYGQGNVGNAEKIGQYQQPEIQSIPWGDTIGSYFNVKLQQKQIDNVDAQTQNIKQDRLNKILQGQLTGAQTGKVRSEGITASNQAKYSQEAFRIQNDLNAETIKKLTSDINLNSKQAQKIIQDTELTRKDLEWMKRTGLHRHDPILAKNVKYLADTTGFSEDKIIMAVGGVIGLSKLLQGITGIIPRSIKPKGKGTETTTWKKGGTTYSETKPIDY